MKRLAVIVCILFLPVTARATKYAGEPYYLGIGGRALSLGGTGVGARPDAASPYWNPAALAVLTNPELLFQHSETFGSLLDHDYVGGALPSGRVAAGWAFGAQVIRLGGGGIQLTEIDSVSGRPRVREEASHSNWTMAVSAARAVGRFGAVAVTAKALLNDIPGNSAWGLGLDLAWWKDWRFMRTGVKVSDVTTTFLTYDSGENETIVPHVNWGGEIDLPEVTDGLRATLAGEAETYFEGRTLAAQYWSGSVSVDLHLGIEINYRNRLYGRVGSDAGELALGAGFAAGRWALDGALTDHGFLDSSYRLSLRFLWP
ncbi:MAG TPA: hypothetical protein VNN55_00360 [bacterium]|nr:hypothetical protein [bacterium]